MEQIKTNIITRIKALLTTKKLFFLHKQKLSFEDKVRAMKMSDIVFIMIESLKNPVTKINMGTFGISVVDGTCYGCAATNTICYIAGVTFNPKNINVVEQRAKFINVDPEFLKSFERTIDALRCGDLYSYNYFAEILKIAVIPDHFIKTDLPTLSTSNYTNRLKDYEYFAVALKHEGF